MSRAKFEEIIHHIEELAESGELKLGSRLPSIRSLADTFSCSLNTVIKAYKELEFGHKIYAVRKSGYYLVEDFPYKKQRGAGETIYDFLSAGPDKHAMPYLDYKHCMNQAIDRYKEDMFTYSELLGLFSLREELARHLRDLQVFTTPERIAVTTGSQQALHLLIRLPFPNGKQTILTEQPAHPSFIESLKHQPSAGIDIGRDGPDLQELETIFQKGDIKFFYVVSRFHNPTGHGYTNEEKRKIVELAERYDVYILEDDYMGDLDPDLKQDPMFAYQPNGRVIYTKSFSKTLLPGLRLGLAVLPLELIERFTKAKFAADVHTPVITQGALEIYLKNGMFAAHIKKIRKLYRKKGEMLRQAYQTLMPDGTIYTCPPSGFYSTVRLPSPLKAEELIQRLKEKHVSVQSTKSMYLEAFMRHDELRLSVSHVEDDMIGGGVALMAETIQEMMIERKKGVIWR
ncbi:PLP-dependent aminotransferase family protein [Rossellomorea sp. YZS02]|uniref:aminotransferase-like domain-containing protein n=1 Tax=Rossellomorea sp. YZS02 TaxID=3097358 RepID=UPI002A0F229A|nr:PLP-dependent aminotransferase family protein [Rossellomorea sp. YZS02]MDX8344603.1 PLP-dependent aminotransferase family protein [Rossellomorea sp. YZS02]